MHPDSQPDTRSPWYEAFAPHASPQVAEVHWIAVGTEAEVEAGAGPAEAEAAKEALFDCYND